MKLQQLYHDKEALEELKKFFIAHVIDEGVKGMLAQEDVAWVAEAHAAILSAFEKMDEFYGHKEMIEKKESINQAR